MTTNRDFDRIAEAWLAEGPQELSDRALDAALDEVHLTHQRRPMTPWRTGSMPSLQRLAAVIAVVAVAIVIGNSVIGNGSTVGSSPTPTRSESPIAAATGSPTTPTAAPTGVLLAPLGYPGTGTIVFTRPDSSGNAIWLINPDGTGEAPMSVTVGPPGAAPSYMAGIISGSGCCAVFSPMGEQIAVGFDEDSLERRGGTFAAANILNLDGSWASMIPTFCGGCGSIQTVNYLPRAWSPDGQLIAVQAWNDASPSRNGINLAPTPNSQSSNPDWDIQVTGHERDVPMAFSPDSSRLLFVRLVDEDSGDLMVLDIQSGTSSQLTTPGQRVFVNGYFGNGASWSPDGRSVAFSSTDNSGNSNAMAPYVIDASGGTARMLSTQGSFITSAQWSPDGSWIAFDRLATGAGEHDLFLVHVDGSGETNLTSGFDPGICCMRWSPDGDALLASGTAGDNGASYLFIVPIEGRPINQVTTVPALYADFSWGRTSR